MGSSQNKMPVMKALAVFLTQMDWKLWYRPLLSPNFLRIFAALFRIYTRCSASPHT